MVRVKLAYPKIPRSVNAPSGRCIAFEKYDGTNLHWVWHDELGWYAFGMRRHRYDFDEQGILEFNASHPGHSDAAKIFSQEFAKDLDSVFRESKYESSEITVFTEFFGANSFAGRHKADDHKQLVLFDVQTEAGIIPPEDFVRDFGFLKIARVVYRGQLTGQFTHDVREGKYKVNEGVVCKGGHGSSLWMVKIKTNDYMDRLKTAFNEDWESYWE